MARGREKAAVQTAPVEGPWELPEGWRWAIMNQVADINPKRDFSGLSDDIELTFVPMAAVAEESGAIDISQRRQVAEIRKGYTRFQSGDVLFAKITPCMENGKAAVVPDVPHKLGAGSTEFHVLAPQEVLPQYLFYWVTQRWFRQEAKFNMTGTAGQKRVPTTWLKSSTIPVPPLETQRRIVARIDELFSELDDGETALAHAREDLEIYRKALLKAAVTGELTADWRAANPPKETGEQLLQRILAERRARWEADPKNKGKRYKEPAAPDTSDLPELPEGWAWASIESLLANEPHALTDGPFGSNLKSAHYQAEGPAVIRLQNIGKQGEFVPAKACISEEHFQSLQRHHVNSGDLVVAILGAPLPRAAIVPESFTPALVKADCFKIRISPDCSTKFVWAWLNSPLLQKRCEEKVHGVGRPRLSMPDIRHLAVPLPPAAEQEQIMLNFHEALAEQQGLLAACLASDDLVKVYKQSILAAAFKGELVQ